jgi:hypothetical protein
MSWITHLTFVGSRIELTLSTKTYRVCHSIGTSYNCIDVMPWYKNFSPLAPKPNSGLGRLHETFRVKQIIIVYIIYGHPVLR